MSKAQTAALPLHFHFALIGDFYMLIQGGPDPSKTAAIEVLHKWPRTSYSRQKAQKRADRFIGEAVRNAVDTVPVTYTVEEV